MGVRFDNDSLCCDSQNADKNLLDGFSDVEASANNNSEIGGGN